MSNLIFLIALDAVAVSFGMFIIHMFLRVFLPRKNHGVFGFAAYALLGICLLLISILLQSMFALLLVTVLGVLSISFLLFDAPWHSRIFTTLGFCFLALVTEFAVGIIMSTVVGAPISELIEFGALRVVGNIMSNLMGLFVIRTVATVLKNNAKHTMRKIWELTPLLVFLVVSIALLIIFIMDILTAMNSAPGILLVKITALTYMNIIAFWYYDRVMRIKEIEHEQEVLSIQTDSQIKYYEMYQKQHDTLVSVLHDIDKHLKVMEGLASGDFDDNRVAEYFDGYKQILSELERTVHTPNPVISIILSDCIVRARNIGIEPDIEVCLGKDLNMDAVDITTILGNSIDNAFAALSIVPECTKRHLRILLCQHGDFLTYEIKNSFVPKTKPVTRRGYGLRNIRACANKYRGSVTCEEKSGMYAVTVMLQL
ncbi:MAG: GHKL domain-containing protein [Oscillospiraceae bacterium]|nr:GHKL domain-containing protein [Oscillospiraceae bacterium]